MKYITYVGIECNGQGAKYDKYEEISNIGFRDINIDYWNEIERLFLFRQY